MAQILPSISIEIVSESEDGLTVGTRGVGTMALQTNWGKTGVYTVNKSTIATGEFKNWFGDTDTTLINLMLSGCNEVLLYASNEGGAKATQTIGTTLTATAKHTGTFGNSIGVEVTESEVITYVEGLEVDRQAVSDFNELTDNEWVTFSGSGTLEQIAPTLLSGGSNGSSVNYTNYLKTIKTEMWDTLACTKKDMNELAFELVKFLREEEGRRVQCVAVDDEANYEGIIKLTEQKVKYRGAELTAEQLTAYVAGITAGATISQSNTYKVTPFGEIVDKLTKTEREKAVLKGYFIFTTRQDKVVVCEYDINSFTAFTKSKNKIFSKNKNIRILDEIYNTIKNKFETTYAGKIDNMEDGRLEYKSDLVLYFTDLQNRRAIQNFKSEDITVAQGEEKDLMLVTVYVTLVDTVDKIKMTVGVR